MAELLVCVAMRREAGDLPESGIIAGWSLRVLVTGIGPVNAAMALTRRLADAPVDLVVSLGVGGAYPDSGLAIGDVACANSDTYADLGADSPRGFLDMRALGFPVVGEHFNRLPLQRFPVARRLDFATRSTCTGRRDEALEIAERTGASVESMEGAAVVHVALAHSVPAAELRGISNLVGDRDRRAWRVDDAAAAAVLALRHWLEEGAC